MAEKSFFKPYKKNKNSIFVSITISRYEKANYAGRLH